MSALKDTPAKELKERYGLEVFVETGTGDGAGLRYAKEIGFTQRFSCDLNPESVKAADDLGVVFHIGSVAFLKAFTSVPEWKPPPPLPGPTLFWLDAHFPERFGALGAAFPLLDELQVIRSRKVGFERDVIICDDIRCIQSDDNPLREAGGGHDWDEVHGLTIAQLVEPFLATHTARLESTISGILILEPR